MDFPNGDRRHYVGITTQERLAARLGEHQRNSGARATQEAKSKGANITIACVYPRACAQVERILSQASESLIAGQICSACMKLREAEANSYPRQRTEKPRPRI